jgi:DNA-directed RNA polymerase I, II, and III subunit RPABC2
MASNIISNKNNEEIIEYEEDEEIEQNDNDISNDEDSSDEEPDIEPNVEQESEESEEDDVEEEPAELSEAEEEEAIKDTVPDEDYGEDFIGDDENSSGINKKKKTTTRRNKNSKVIDYKTFQSIAGGGISSSVDLGDEESEINLRKFESEISKDYLIDFHPEIKAHNYDEISTLSTVVRNKSGQIIDNFHKTLPFVSKFEKARILGVRAKQINHGATVMIDVPEHIIDGYTIALMEYEQKKIPFIIKRPLPNGTVEYWKFTDLEQINL